MNPRLIMTYSLDEHSLYNRDNNTSIKGSWLYNLAKKIFPLNTDSHISLIGLDKDKRIEISISLALFERMRGEPEFMQKAENLRRLRSYVQEGMTVLETLCQQRLTTFDNDLDCIS